MSSISTSLEFSPGTAGSDLEALARLSLEERHEEADIDEMLERVAALPPAMWTKADQGVSLIETENTLSPGSAGMHEQLLRRYLLGEDLQAAEIDEIWDCIGRALNEQTTITASQAIFCERETKKSEEESQEQKLRIDKLLEKAARLERQSAAFSQATARRERKNFRMARR